MADPIRNFFKSTLVGTYSDSDTSITIATGDGALLPDPSTDGAFNLTIFEGLQVTNSTEFEIVRVTARSGDVLTVTRGAESTTPLTIGSATHSILMSATKKTFDDINTAIENVDLTTLTGVEELTFDSTGDEEFGLPAGTTAQRPSSPSAGYMRWNSTDSRIEFYNGSRWAGLSEIGFQQADLGVAQLSVTANDAVFLPPLEVEYLVIAGGGGGGAKRGGGGGAGGYRTSAGTQLALSTNYTVTVGAGGSGSAIDGNNGSDGSNSVFDTDTSTGGGGAGSVGNDGRNGGSGGGAGGVQSSSSVGGSGTANQGNDGGDGANFVDVGINTRGAGGGGGASSLGQDASTTSAIAGDGGDGSQSSITGNPAFYAGGGGGGIWGGRTAGTGGLGGGGNGEDGDFDGEDGDANTGGGGGGGGDQGGGGGIGGSGGSGIVILKYPDTFTISVGAGLTSSTSTSGGYSVTQFTAGTDDVSFSTT